MPRTVRTTSQADRQLLSELGARLRLARLRRKLSVAAIARRAGVSRTTIYKAESGDEAATMGAYLRLLAVLGLERDLARVADDDTIGRRLQDMRLELKEPKVKATRSAAASARVNEDRQITAWRPRTLREVAARGREKGDTDSFLREFLDEFYLARDVSQRAAMIAEEPPLAPDDRTNAYLAAVAEHLALRNGLPVPSWTGKPGRFLKRPLFAGGLESLKATLLVESPTAFRRRMIFVGADPLYRPRKDAIGIGG